MGYFKDNIAGATGYIPGQQADTSRLVKLNTNENPYPPSPEVMKAISSVDPESLRIYPDPSASKLAMAAAEVFGVPSDHILVGNGSDNLIVMIARSARGPIVVPSPTFPYYGAQAQVEGCDFVEVPLLDDFALPLEDLARTTSGVVFIANPNSPTSTVAGVNDLDDLAGELSGKALLVIDEAYVDFTRHSAMGLVGKRDNVIILRTLSKGYSLAGLRLGFAIAAPCILEQLDKAREIYNVGAVTQAAGIAAMGDQEHKNANVERVIRSRDMLTEQLRASKWEVVPPNGNFILARPPGGNAEYLCARLKDRGIYVRYFNHPDLKEYLRITAGTDEQHVMLLQAVSSILSEM